MAAGRQRRNMALAADELSPDERVKKIAAQFAMFKNPDKETVLTPWRVVNMHMSDCLGGYCFYNDDFTDIIDEPRFVNHGKVTEETFANTKAQILEINSKTGLYPLYVTYSIYRKRCEEVKPEELTIEKQYELWQKTVEDNIFVICKTPMAKAITRRTLLGYRKGKINAHAFDDLIMQLKEKPEQFREKILRGSFWNKEYKEMKFDAVVGNPPYQGTNHSQIYPFFYLVAKELSNKYVSLIFPTGWQEPKNANNLCKLNTEAVKRDRQIVQIDNRQNVFPGISGAEWVNILLWQKNYDNGLDGEQLILTNGTNPVIKKLTTKVDSIVKPKEILDLSNIVQKSNNFQSVQSIMSTSKPYGLRKDAFNRLEYYHLDPMFKSRQNVDDIKIYGSNNSIRYVPYNYKLPRKTIAFNKYKVLVGSAWGNMSEKTGLGGAYANIIIATPFEICTETYQESGVFNDFETAKKHAKYLMTKFVRALLYVNKISQMSTRAWCAVPIQDYHENWWDRSIKEIDVELIKKYNIPDEISDFINRNIQQKTEKNIINYN